MIITAGVFLFVIGLLVLALVAWNSAKVYGAWEDKYKRQLPTATMFSFAEASEYYAEGYTPLQAAEHKIAGGNIFRPMEAMDRPAPVSPWDGAR